MAFHVYPDPQTAPLSVPANSVFPVPPAAPIPIDLAVGAGTTKIMRLVMLPGAVNDPHVIFKADTGDEVEVSPTGFAVSVFNGPGNTGNEVLDVIMTLDDAAHKIYKLQLFLFDAATFGIRIKNTDVAAHEFTWVVADSEADSQQPWISVAPTLNFNVLTTQSVPLAVQVDNKGTGPLVISDAVGLGLGSTFTLTAVPGPVQPNPAIPSSVQVTFVGGANPGASSGIYTIASNDTTALTTGAHNKRVALAATTGKLEIALVLDGSGSMGSKPDGNPVGAGQKSRWDWLRSASQDLLDLLNTFANGFGKFAIDVFPDLVTHLPPPSAGDIQPVQPINPANITAAELALNNASLVPTNSTPMSAGINRAMGFFDADTASKQFNHRFMIIMSDGAHNSGPDPATLFQTGPTSFAATNINALTIGFGLLSATIFQVNWALLQDIAGWSPNGAFHDSGVDDTGTNVDGNMGLTLHKVFEKALSATLSLPWASDPRDILTAAHPEKRYTINVLPYDRKVVFIVRWTTFGRAVHVEIETANCEIITAASAASTPGVHFSSSPLYQMFSFDESYLRNQAPAKPRFGPWNLIVSVANAASLGSEIFEYSVITDSRLKMDVKFDRKRYFAGDTVGVTARLTLDGLPVRNATVVIEQAAPGQSLDNFLADAIVTDGDLVKARAAAGTQDFNAVGLRALALRLKGQTFTAGNAPTSKPMTDPGNIGVYRASFTNTTVPGNYDYRVVAIGQTADGVDFRREQEIYMRLEPNPLPAFTLTDVVYQFNPTAQANQAIITIHPQDAHGNKIVFDSALSNRLGITVQNGQLAGPLIFNGNGSYTQRVTYAPSVVPTVKVSHNGAVIVPQQSLAHVSNLHYADTVLAFVRGREAAPGANQHTDPNAVLGDVTRKANNQFLSLGAFGSVTVGVKGKLIVAQGADDITVFIRLDSDLRSYKVEALPENGPDWVPLGTSRGVTQSFALSAAGLKSALAVRVVDTSGRLRDHDRVNSPTPGTSAVGFGFPSVGDPAHAPVIAAGGVINGASFQPGLSGGEWVTVRGTNLAASTRTWGPADIVNGHLPTSLDGSGVNFNGKPGYVFFISPTQINVLSPNFAAGAVQVQAFSHFGSSQVVSVQAGRVSPGLFLVLAKQHFVLAHHLDGTLVGNPGLVPGKISTPALPGETITFTGTGFGATKPPEPEGMEIIKPAPLALPVAIRIGGLSATLTGAEMREAGTITFSVVVPSALQPGEAELIATVADAKSASGVVITIGSAVVIL